MRSNNTFKNLFNLMLVFSMLSMGLAGCDLLDSNKDNDNDNDDLYVKFYNDSSSICTIVSIELQGMGDADGTTTPSGQWSENVLKDGKEITPGAFQYFHADIPAGEWSKYRLGIKEENGTIIMLHEQQGYTDQQLPITHWGSDERTVTVNIVKHSSTGLIYVNGWSEWAGIED